MAENKSLFTFLLLTVLLACCLQPLSLSAQTDLGAIRGRVQDQRGGSIVGATITVRNDSTSWQRTTQSDASGDYILTGVPLTGQYTVSATASQFKTAQEDRVQLRAATTATVNFVLDVSGEKAEVNVFGTPDSLPTESNQVS